MVMINYFRGSCSEVKFKFTELIGTASLTLVPYCPLVIVLPLLYPIVPITGAFI